MPILTARAAADRLEPHFAGLARERLVIVFLAGDDSWAALDRHDGASASVGLPFRAIVARALELDAAGVVIAHNHLSGDPGPSASDVRLTRRLALVLDALGILLHDHLIYADGEWESFRRLGLL